MRNETYKSQLSRDTIIGEVYEKSLKKSHEVIQDIIWETYELDQFSRYLRSIEEYEALKFLI